MNHYENTTSHTNTSLPSNHSQSNSHTNPEDSGQAHPEGSDPPPEADLRHIKIASLQKQARNKNIFLDLTDDAESVKDRLPDQAPVAPPQSAAASSSPAPDQEQAAQDEGPVPNSNIKKTRVEPPSTARVDDDLRKNFTKTLLRGRIRKKTTPVPAVEADKDGFIQKSSRRPKGDGMGPVGFDHGSRSARPDLYGRNKHGGQPAPDAGIRTISSKPPMFIPPGPYMINDHHDPKMDGKQIFFPPNRYKNDKRDGKAKKAPPAKKKGREPKPGARKHSKRKREKSEQTYVDLRDLVEKPGMVVRWFGYYPFQTKEYWAWTEEECETYENNPYNLHYVPKPEVPGSHPLVPTMPRSSHKYHDLPAAAPRERVEIQPRQGAFQTDHRNAGSANVEIGLANQRLRKLEERNEELVAQVKQLQAHNDQLQAYNEEEISSGRQRCAIERGLRKKAEKLAASSKIALKTQSIQHAMSQEKLEIDADLITTLLNESERDADLSQSPHRDMSLMVSGIDDRMEDLQKSHSDIQTVLQDLYEHYEEATFGDVDEALDRIRDLVHRIDSWQSSLDQEVCMVKMRVVIDEQWSEIRRLARHQQSFEKTYHGMQLETVKTAVEQLLPHHLETESILAGFELAVKEPHQKRHEEKCKAIFQLGQASAMDPTSIQLGRAQAMHLIAQLVSNPDDVDANAKLELYGQQYAELIIQLYPILHLIPAGNRTTNPFAGILKSMTHPASYKHPVHVHRSQISDGDPTRPFYVKIVHTMQAAGDLNESKAEIPRDIAHYTRKCVPPAALVSRSHTDVSPRIEPPCMNPRDIDLNAQPLFIDPTEMNERLRGWAYRKEQWRNFKRVENWADEDDDADDHPTEMQELLEDWSHDPALRSDKKDDPVVDRPLASDK